MRSGLRPVAHAARGSASRSSASEPRAATRRRAAAGGHRAGRDDRPRRIPARQRQRQDARPGGWPRPLGLLLAGGRPTASQLCGLWSSDIAPLVEKIDDPNMVNDKDLQEVVQMLDDACKDIGFFYVKGHGICELLMKEVRDVAQKFFQLPYEEKMKIKMTRQNGYRGYQRLGEFITMGKPDMHEAINYLTPIVPGKYGNLGKAFEGSNLWPEYPSNSKLLLENYINLLKDLSRKIMRGIALALGGPVDAFEGIIAGDPYWGIRLVSYPGWLIDIPEEKCANTGMGSHTDYGLLTLVNQDDDICALEVQNQSGEWMHARPIPGTFVCNIGDMLEVYSNGIYHPTVHRVVNNSPCCRVSAVFFYETNFDTAIEPVGFCKEKTGGVAKYEKVVYGEHLFRMACDCYDDV